MRDCFEMPTKMSTRAKWTRFQHGNARPQTDRLTKRLPPESQRLVHGHQNHLNPIEHLWEDLDRRYKQSGTILLSLIANVEHAARLWLGLVVDTQDAELTSIV